MATKTIRRIYTDSNGLEHYTTHTAPMDYQIRAGTQTDKFGKDFREEEFNPSAASQISRGVAPSVAGTAIAGMSNQSGAGVTQGIGAAANAAANVAANRLQAYHADSKLAAMSAAGISTGASAARSAANQEMLRTGNVGNAALAGLAGGTQGLVGGAISSIPGAKSLAAGLPNMIGGFMSGGLAGGLHGFASGVMTSKTLGDDMANLMQRSQAKDYNEGTWGSSMTNIEDENRQDALAKEQKIRENAHNKAISDGEVDEDRIKAAGDAAVAAHRQNVAQPQAAAQQPFNAAAPLDVPTQNLPAPSDDAENNPVERPQNLADPQTAGAGLPNFAAIPTGNAGAGDNVGAYFAARNPPPVAPSRFGGNADVRPAGADATQSPAAAAAAAPVAPPPPAAAAPVAAAAAAPVPAPAPMPAAPAAAAMPVAPRMDTVNPEAPTYDDITGDNNFFPQVSVPNVAAGVAAAVAPQARLNLPNEENVAADAAAAAPPLPPPPPLPPVEPPRYIDTRAAATHAPAAVAPVRAAAAAAAPAPAQIPNAEDAPEIPDMTPEEIQARMDSDANFSAADLNDRELAAFEIHQNKLLEDVAENATDESLDAKIREHARRINSSEEFARQALPDEVLLNHPHLRGRFMRVIPDTDEELEERANQIAAAELDEANPDSIPEDWRQFASGETMDNIGIQQGRHANLTDESGAVTVNGKKYFRTPFGLVRAYDKDRESKDIGNAYQATLYHMESELRAGHLDVAKQIYDSLHREDRGILQTSKDRVRQTHMMLNDMTSVLGQKALDGNTTLGELNHLADLAKQEFENVPENLRDKRHVGSEKTLREIYDNFTEQFDHAIDLRQERGMNRDTVLGFEMPQWMTGKPAPRRSVGAAVGRDGIDGSIRHHDDDDEDSYDEDDDDEGGVAAAAAPVRNLLHMAGEGGERSGLLQEGEPIPPEEFEQMRRDEIARRHGFPTVATDEFPDENYDDYDINDWVEPESVLDNVRHKAGNAAMAATHAVRRVGRAIYPYAKAAADWIAPPAKVADLTEGRDDENYSDYNMRQLWREQRKDHDPDGNHYENFRNRANELLQNDSIDLKERQGFYNSLNSAEKNLVQPPTQPPSMMDRAADYARRVGEYIAPIYQEGQTPPPDIFDHIGNFLGRRKSAAAESPDEENELAQPENENATQPQEKSAGLVDRLRDVARDTQDELEYQAERARLRLQSTAKKVQDKIAPPPPPKEKDLWGTKSRPTTPRFDPRVLKPTPPPPKVTTAPTKLIGRYARKSLEDLQSQYPDRRSIERMSDRDLSDFYDRLDELHKHNPTANVYDAAHGVPDIRGKKYDYPPPSSEMLDRVKQIDSRKSAAASFPKPMSIAEANRRRGGAFASHSLSELEAVVDGHDRSMQQKNVRRRDDRPLADQLDENFESYKNRANEIMGDTGYPYDDRLRLKQRLKSKNIDVDDPKIAREEPAEPAAAAADFPRPDEVPTREPASASQIENDRQKDLTLAGAKEARVDPEIEKRNLPFVENLPKKYPPEIAEMRRANEEFAARRDAEKADIRRRYREDRSIEFPDFADTMAAIPPNRLEREPVAARRALGRRVNDFIGDRSLDVGQRTKLKMDAEKAGLAGLDSTPETLDRIKDMRRENREREKLQAAATGGRYISPFEAAEERMRRLGFLTTRKK